MNLLEIIDKQCCTVDLIAHTKDQVLLQLAELAVKNEQMKKYSVETVYQALRAREDEGSTGFGDGIALPHIRLAGLDNFLVLIALAKQPVDFDAIDKKKVRLFFVIIAPEKKVTEHVQLLASIARTISPIQVKKELLNAKTQGVLYETFIKFIQKSGGSDVLKRNMKLLYVVLYLDEFLYHILEYFIQEGIDGATIIESSGMGQYISNIPMFASFIGFMNEKKNISKTIMALVPEDREAEIVAGIEQITGDLDKKEGAIIISVDVSFYKGSMRMMG